MTGVAKLNIHDVAGGAVIAVKVVPGASGDRLVGPLGGFLKIATAAPAEKGRANAAVCKILARLLGLNRRDVRLISGRTAPHKQFGISGISAAAVRDALRRV